MYLSSHNTMKKANSKNEEKVPAEMIIPDEQLGRAKMFLKFPVTDAERNNISIIRDLELSIKDFNNNVSYHEVQLTNFRGMLRTNKIELRKVINESNAETISMEDAKGILAEVAKLPWIEKVSLEGMMLHLFTRKNILKTVFDRRVVGIGGGSFIQEFLEVPVTASMPQYEIRISLMDMGGNWALNADVLALRFSNEEDISHFDGKRIVKSQMITPHWAANGTHGFGNWEYLCLGEYEEDLKKESAKGLVPFLNQLALYLQLSGDEHAYRSKPVWSLLIGKKEYSEFNGRVLRKNETGKEVNEKYTRDYKLLRQPEGAKEVARNATGVTTTTGTTNHLDAMLRALNGNVWVTNTLTMPDVVPHADCDCDMIGITDLDARLCDCGYVCDCHMLPGPNTAENITFRGIDIIPDRPNRNVTAVLDETEEDEPF